MARLMESHAKTVAALTEKLEKISMKVKEKLKIPPLNSENVTLFMKKSYLPKWMVSSLDCLWARFLRKEEEERTRAGEGEEGLVAGVTALMCVPLAPSPSTETTDQEA